MSADDFQQLLKHLEHRISGLDVQKQQVADLTREIESLERLSATDPAARQKLQALQQYQQSDRFVALREKALKEMAVLQQQYAQLQQAPSSSGMQAVNNVSVRHTEKTAAPAARPKRRLYI